jgi:hypothetical protein
MKRRTFLGTGALMPGAVLLPGMLYGKPSAAKARIGFIGLGLRGRSHLRNLLLRKDVTVPALCDIDRDALDQAVAMCLEKGASIVLTHDTNLPRPYSLGSRVQGVIGITEFDYHTRRIYLEGKSPRHSWEEMDACLDAYDAAAWSAITPLSEMSIKNNGEPMMFPDFTRGRWMKWKNAFVLNDDF